MIIVMTEVGRADTVGLSDVDMILSRSKGISDNSKSVTDS
jgi:hypothetical protein